VNSTLTNLANSIGDAHAAVDEVIEFVDSRDGERSSWRLVLADEPPGEVEEGSDPDSDPVRLVQKLPDVPAAQYAYRELLRRGFSDDTREWEGRYLVISPR
jgi:hypothetical protein